VVGTFDCAASGEEADAYRAVSGNHEELPGIARSDQQTVRGNQGHNLWLNMKLLALSSLLMAALLRAFCAIAARSSIGSVPSSSSSGEPFPLTLDPRNNCKTAFVQNEFPAGTCRITSDGGCYRKPWTSSNHLDVLESRIAAEQRRGLEPWRIVKVFMLSSSFTK
jgi:hypothetical protein